MIKEDELVLDCLNTLDKFFEDIVVFANFLGYDKITKMHNDWFKYLFLNKKELVILQAHRNSYKTTLIIIAIALFLLANPKMTILIVRKTEELAIQLVFEIQKIIKSEEYRFLMKNLHNINYNEIKETQNKIDFGFCTREPNVLSASIGKNLTGLHFDMIICDDIVTEKDRYSKKERETTKKFFWELKNILKKESVFKKIVLIGTPWSSDDLFAELEKKEFDILKYDIYRTNIFNQKEILELRNLMPISLFACNYELKHISSEENYFNNLKIENIDFNGKKCYMHIDTAFTGEDYTAITLCFIENNKFFVRGFCKKINAFDLIDYFINLINNYNVLRVYIESNSDQGGIARELRKKAMINIISYKEKVNKHLKILENIKKNFNKIILDINSDKEYLEQILNYSDFVKNDDAPDSLASIIKFLNTDSKKVFIS